MGFLILSEGGDGLGLATRLKAEGHPVSLWIREEKLAARGEGLVDKGNNVGFQPVVVADCSGAGALLDTYRDAGVLTFGGSAVADRLEHDRSYASEIFARCGIKQPRSWSFTSWQDGEAFIKTAEQKLVFKPCGKNSGNIPSYVPKNNKDLLDVMAHYRSLIGEQAVEFVLQEFIEGICISTECFYAKTHAAFPTNHTLERKQFMNGDIGPSGGCTGNVVWACDDEDCPLCDMLAKLEPFLEENAWVGPIDINTVVTKEGEAYALEFTPRFGYDAFPTLLYGLYAGNFGTFLWDCARGDSDVEMSLRDGFAAGVRVSVPPWPSEEFVAKAGQPIRGLREADSELFYPYEVAAAEGKGLICAGGVGIIGVAVGWGKNIEEAFAAAYEVVDRIQLPDKQYRTDFVQEFEKDFRRLSRREVLNGVY